MSILYMIFCIFYIDIMKMKKKYFAAQGETAFRLWIFSMALEELKKSPKNSEKTSTLLAKVKAFTEGNWVKYNASDEQKTDLNAILGELALLCAK